MKIKRLILGSLETNCYILENNDEILIIDPAYNYEEIIKAIDNKKILGVIVTHYHFDHIGALPNFKDKYKIYDYNNLSDNNEVGNFKFKRLITKGHTDDSISIYFEKEKLLFCGDFIFKHEIGRCDLGGNVEDMKKSIEYIKIFPKDIIIYPGHGESTTLEDEIANNYYFNNNW
jgi:metallo-beta-lactamase family protein